MRIIFLQSVGAGQFLYALTRVIHHHAAFRRKGDPAVFDSTISPLLRGFPRPETPFEASHPRIGLHGGIPGTLKKFAVPLVRFSSRKPGPCVFLPGFQKSRRIEIAAPVRVAAVGERKMSVERIRILDPEKSDLLELVPAANFRRLGAGLLQRREKKGCQNHQNRNDDHQLHYRKPSLFLPHITSCAFR